MILRKVPFLIFSFFRTAAGNRRALRCLYLVRFMAKQATTRAPHTKTPVRSGYKSNNKSGAKPKPERILLRKSLLTDKKGIQPMHKNTDLLQVKTRKHARRYEFYPERKSLYRSRSGQPAPALSAAIPSKYPSGATAKKSGAGTICPLFPPFRQTPGYAAAQPVFAFSQNRSRPDKIRAKRIKKEAARKPIASSPSVIPYFFQLTAASTDTNDLFRYP